NVLLPIHNEEPVVAADDPSVAQSLARSIMVDTEAGQQASAKHNGTPLPSLSGLRVLVVDDAADTLEFISEVLRKANVAITSATSVTDALDAFERARPQVVISDIAMPERDGYDFLQAVRELGPGRGGDVPVIALTA